LRSRRSVVYRKHISDIPELTLVSVPNYPYFRNIGNMTLVCISDIPELMAFEHLFVG